MYAIELNDVLYFLKEQVQLEKKSKTGSTAGEKMGASFMQEPQHVCSVSLFKKVHIKIKKMF